MVICGIFLTRILCEQFQSSDVISRLFCCNDFNIRQRTNRVPGFKWHQSEAYTSTALEQLFSVFAFCFWHFSASSALNRRRHHALPGAVAQQLVCCLYVWPLRRRQTWKFAWAFARKQRAKRSETHRAKRAKGSEMVIASPRVQTAHDTACWQTTFIDGGECVKFLQSRPLKSEKFLWQLKYWQILNKHHVLMGVFCQ